MIELTVPFTEMTAEHFQTHLDQRSVNTHDPDAVARWFNEGGVQRRGPGLEARGRTAVRDAMAQLFAAFPDFRVEVRDLFTAGRRTCVECRITGTHEGTFSGVPATGGRIDVEACLVFRWGANDLVDEEVVYMDGAVLLAQIGVLPAG